MGELKLDVVFTFETIECCECSAIFAVSSTMKQRWKDDGRSFWCPTCGTSQSYKKSRVKQLEEALQMEKGRLERKNQEITFLNRQIAAQKGQTTKLKNRIAKGVCPCCQRSFQNLKRHMESQHPEYAAGEPAGGKE